MNFSRKESDNATSVRLKTYMRQLVSETKKYPSIFKYCDLDGAIKMLSSHNLQFTRADSLNDKDEVNISKCDFSSHIMLLKKYHIPERVINAKIDDAKKFFSGIGICSCGKSPNNEVLWNRYSRENEDAPEDGVCIELDQSMVINNLLSKGIKVIALLVKYFDNVNGFIPWNLFLGNQFEKSIFFHLLYSSKERIKWESEDEIRLIYSEPFEGKHFRPVLDLECFKAVYYGKNITPQQRIQIEHILNKYPKIERYFRCSKSL